MVGSTQSMKLLSARSILSLMFSLILFIALDTKLSCLHLAKRQKIFRGLLLSQNRAVLLYPKYEEQEKIGEYFSKLDSLITLHQREPPKEDKILNDIKTDTLFHEYYCQWLVIYKEGSVRGVTMQKYHLTAEWVKKLIPDVKLCDFDRITYQQLINDYAETHERQTTMDFHHQLKGAILDAVDDGLIARDPTRKVIIKGKSPNDKKKKLLRPVCVFPKQLQ